MKKILRYFILLMALALAGIVAVVSVSGLVKVFAGAGTMGLIFFILIEFSKIVGTSAVHTYKKTIHWGYRYAMMLAIVIAMGITSMGIYGFLSNSYKQATDSMALINSKVEIIKAKKKIAEEDKSSFNLQIEQKRERIKSLTEVRKSQETRMDSLNARGQTWYAGKVQKAVDKADENIEKADNEIGILSEKVGVVNDSLASYEIQILELEHNSEGASELNSLKYLSDVTGMSMDNVMKWFIFLLILIGDPMAVLFVIYFNKIFNEVDDNDIDVINILPDGPNDGPNDYINQIQNNMRYGIPIKDDVINDAVNDAVEIEDLEPFTEYPESMEKFDEIEEVIKVPSEVDHQDKPLIIPEVEPEIEITPEDQIEENIEEVKQLKREPVVPRGKIIEEDLEQLRDRGFTVPIPDPKPTKITKIGTNKELHDNKNNKIWFKRKRRDEIGND